MPQTELERYRAERAKDFAADDSARAARRAEIIGHAVSDIRHAGTVIDGCAIFETALRLLENGAEWETTNERTVKWDKEQTAHLRERLDLGGAG